MAQRFDRSYPVAATPAEIAAAVRSPESAAARLQAAGRQDPRLVSHQVSRAGDGTEVVRIVARYYTPVSDMPSWMAGRFTDHGPENVRTEIWRLTADDLQGEVVVDAVGNGGRVTASYQVTAAAAAAATHGAPAGSVWRVTGEASFRIPLLGKRIESFVVASLERAYAAEAEEMSARVVRIG